MHKLIAELLRLYLPAEALTPEALALHVQGQQNAPVSLTGSDGLTRALMIPFRKTRGADSEAHWTRLCEVANALQATLKLPAPAVSISGGDAYYLWLSFAPPVPAERAQAFLERLRDAHFAELELAPDAVRAPLALPPCLHPRTGKWAAFIHPGMGASFADEPGLDMQPPPNGQASFLEGLESIDEEQFERAWRLLAPAPAAVAAGVTAPAPTAAAPDTPVLPLQGAPRAAATPLAAGLLLQDATLEDIVRHLHAQNIEPTFRHLLAPGALAACRT